MRSPGPALSAQHPLRAVVAVLGLGEWPGQAFISGSSASSSQHLPCYSQSPTPALPLSNF